MIILSLNSGLGNQMFQYAYAKKLAQLYSEDKIYLDLHYFKRDPDGRQFSLSNYKLSNKVCYLNSFSTSIVEVYTRIVIKLVKLINDGEDKEAYDRVLNRFGIHNANYEFLNFKRKKINIINGVFQHSGYFKEVEGEVKNDFLLSEELNLEVTKVLEDIKNSESVCVHIRRGDYVDNPVWSAQLNICGEEYYKAAVEYIRDKVPNAKMFVFSNTHKDIEWIKQNYDLGNVIYVDMSNKDYEDLWLMKSCKHFVMSNSSYSWWAQFLGEYDNKIVVAPEYWDASKNRYPGIYMNSWHIINI